MSYYKVTKCSSSWCRQCPMVGRCSQHAVSTSLCLALYSAKWCPSNPHVLCLSMEIFSNHWCAI